MIKYLGTGFYSINHEPTIASYAKQHRVMQLITTHAKERLKERYAELRRGALSEAHIYERFTSYQAGFSKYGMIKDCELWSNMPGGLSNCVSQICENARLRLKALDEEMEYSADGGSELTFEPKKTVVTATVSGHMTWGSLNTESTDWATSDFIPVSGDNVSVVCSPMPTNHTWLAFNWYDADKKYINQTSDNSGDEDITGKIYSGAAYLRLSFPADCAEGFKAVTTTYSPLAKKLSELEDNPKSGKTISIIGDSISSHTGTIPEGYSPYYGFSNQVGGAENMWWKKLCDKLGMRLLVNASWSGSTVTGNSSDTESAACAASDKRIADLAADGENPDNIVVFIGTNDLLQGKSFGNARGCEAIAQSGTVNTISEAYVLLLKKLMLEYPSAMIYCATLLPSRQNYNGDATYNDSDFPPSFSGGTVQELNAIIREIAANMGCGLIDFARCGINYFNLPTLTVDGKLHPNAKGHQLMADCAQKALKNA